jgi:hypothetical protein
MSRQRVVFIREVAVLYVLSITHSPTFILMYASSALGLLEHSMHFFDVREYTLSISAEAHTQTDCTDTLPVL